MEELNLDSKLLEPIKIKLEQVINDLMLSAIIDNKEAEIDLKIDLKATKRDTTDKFGKIIKEWKEPSIDYQISQKIKEYKGSFKSFVGNNYKIEIADDKIKVENLNEQTSMFDKEGDK